MRLRGHQMEENTFQVCSLTASWEDLSHSSETKKGARLIILVIFHHSPKPSCALLRGLFIPNSSQVSSHELLLLSHSSFHPDATLRMQELSLPHDVAQHFSQGLWIRWPHVLSLNPSCFVQLLAPMSALGPLNYIAQLHLFETIWLLTQATWLHPSPPPNTFCANPHRRNKSCWKCKLATHVVTLCYLGSPTQMYREIMLMEWCVLSDLELSLKDKCQDKAETFNQK